MLEMIQSFAHWLLGPKDNNLLVNNELQHTDDLSDLVDDIRQKGVIIEEPQNNLVEEEKESFNKPGKITLINNYYVLIDNKFMCELKNININRDNLKVGDEVLYQAQKINRGEGIKVQKIIAKFEDQWENDKENIDVNCEAIDKIHKTESNQILNEPSSNNNLERPQIIKKVIYGIVVERKGREVILEEGHTVNLDAVQSTFIPMNGDFVKMQCVIKTDKSMPNNKSEILQTYSIFPVRKACKVGKITKYNEAEEHGTIEKDIIFVRAVCASGYVPRLGDRVISECIKRDQRLQHKWRALTVHEEYVCKTHYFKSTTTVKVKNFFFNFYNKLQHAEQSKLMYSVV